MPKPLAVLSLSLLLYGCTASVADPAGTPHARLNEQRRAEAPVTLTASDGTGLQLTSFESKAVVSGPLAFTELHLEFENPENRTLEGRFQITLPPGAAISRLAMRIGNRWQEAEMVELQAAREAYEDFLHQRQDPALLEKQAGNQFQARIFPIPAKGRKELILSYSQERTAGQPYVLPLSGLPKVARLRATALVPPETLQLALDNAAPSGDWEITCTSAPTALVHDKLVVFEVTPPVADAPDPVDSLLVLFDASASRAAGFAAQQQLLDDLLRELPAGRTEVACFDQEAGGVDFHQVRPLGATDLARALKWASARQGFNRLLVITDGVVTAGKNPSQVPGFRRCDAIVVGGIRNAQALRRLCQQGVVLDADDGAKEIARRLNLAAPASLRPEVQGARWVWPETVQGGPSLVFTELKEPAQEVKVTLGGAPYTFPLTPINGPLLSRAAAQARIASLESRLAEAGPLKQATLREQIVSLSTTQRVASSLTALLVLETDDDYVRFGLNRRALADILVVGAEGLETHQGRTLAGQDEGKAPPPPPPGGSPFPQWNQQTNSPGALNTTFTETSSRPKTGLANIGIGYSGGRSGTVRPGVTGAVSFSDGNDGRGPLPGGATRLDPLPGGAPRVDPRATPRQDPLARPAEPPVQPSRQVFTPRPSVRAAKPSRTARRPHKKLDDDGTPPVTGKLADVLNLIQAREPEAALKLARTWQAEAPGDVLALLALGKALNLDVWEAARAYGSIIDLYPGRADLLRFAGCCLESLWRVGTHLALDAFRRALAQRPDHPSSYRMLAYAQLRAGDSAGAFETLEKGVLYPYPENRFRHCDLVLRDDMGLVAAAWLAEEPQHRKDVIARLDAVEASLETKPSTRFVLTWETDANDVDFHIQDGQGGHAWYSHPDLASGGTLYGDVTTGYGPECFVIPGEASAYPYQLTAHYYSRGPMGYGMGNVEVIQHDGKGDLRFRQLPFVVMNDGAYVDLGVLTQPLPPPE